MDSNEHVSDLDAWRIGRLREQPRASRLDDLLLDERNAAAGHVLFQPTPGGYALLEADGPPPELDRPLLIDGRRYRVLRVGRSPLPADRRPCLYLGDW